jgi:hypothetical protein
MTTESLRKGTDQSKAPGPKGMDIDKVLKFGWKKDSLQGVPFLARKEDLHVDETYQRSVISEPKVLQMAQAWSWLSCGSLIVAERDGKLRLIDGQHRWVAAMRRSDVTELPCLVFKTESAEEEAMAFFLCNCARTNVTPFDKLRALLSAHDPLAIDAVNLMQQYGYRPSAGEGPNTLRCVAMFVGMMKSDRGVLKKVWPIVAELHDNQAIRARVLADLVYIGKHGTDDVTSSTWRIRVLRAGIDAISGSIDRKYGEIAQGGAKVFALGALEVINRGVRGNHRLRIREQDDTSEDSDGNDRE